MSAFPGIGHLALGEKCSIYVNMVSGCTNMPTLQNILSLEKLYLTISSSSAPVLSSVYSFSSVFSSVMLLLPLSAASTSICFLQNSDFKILDGCLKVLKCKKNVKIYQIILGQIVENHKKFL